MAHNSQAATVGRLGQAAAAVRLSIPVALAYIPLGIAFGVLLVTSGIRWFWAPLSALLIFAGSIEFLGVTLMVSGVSVLQVAFTALIVNFRHIFYGLTFPVTRLRTTPQRVYGVFALTDETYGITSAGPGAAFNGFQITVLQVVSHVWWVGGALLGSAIGQVIPPEIKGFGFALTAMFITLAVNAVQSSRDYSLLVYAAIAGVVAFGSDHYVYPESFLIVGLLVYLTLVSATYLRRRPEMADA